jgi:hypothetical protein
VKRRVKRKEYTMGQCLDDVNRALHRYYDQPGVFTPDVMTVVRAALSKRGVSRQCFSEH